MRLTGSWFTLDSYDDGIKAIKTQRDRGAAIIAGSMVEGHLAEAIKARFERNSNVEDKLFKGYGPLATFSAKIDLGLLVGIYNRTEFGISPIQFHRNLHTIREIRNEFAHNFGPITFKSQRLRDLCKNLVPKKGATRKPGLAMTLTDEKGEEHEITLRVLPRSTNPRTQFINYVKYCVFYLTRETWVDTFPEWTKSPDKAPQPTGPED
jgi:hypothetical protein